MMLVGSKAELVEICLMSVRDWLDVWTFNMKSTVFMRKVL